MATSSETYKVIVETAQAETALTKLQNKLQSTQQGFAKLNQAIAGLALGGFVKSAFDMADAMSDLADATELSIASVMGFSKAVALSGGSTEGAGKSLLKFSENISSAAEGSASLQDAFRQVGISLVDLGRLSAQDLLAKTIDGLSRVSDVSTRLKLQSDLLGKGFKGVNVSSVRDSYTEQTAASKAAAESTKKAAEAVDKLNAVITKMKEQVLVALTPVIDTFNKMPIERIASMTKLLVELGLAWGVFKTGQMVFSGFGIALSATSALFSKAAIGLGSYSKSVVTLNITTLELVKNLLSTGKTGLGVGESFKVAGLATMGWAKGLAAGLTGVMSLVGGLALLVAQILLVNDAIAAITGMDFIDTWAKSLESFVKDKFPKLYGAIDSLGKKMGMADINGKPQTPTGQGNFDNEDEAALRKMAEDRKAEADAAREVQDALAKQRVEISKIVADYKIANSEAFKRYTTETSMIGQSTEEQARMQLRNEKEIDYLNTKKTIQEKIDTINKSGTRSEKEDLLPALSAEMADLTAEYQKQLVLVDQMVASRAKEEAAQQQKLFTISQELQLGQQLRSLQNETAKVFLPEIDKKYKDIVDSANEAAKAQIAAESARRGNVPLSAEEEAAIYKAATDGVNALTASTARLNEEQNKFQLYNYGIQQQISLSNSLNQIQDDMAKMTMPEIEKKYYDIAAAARDSAKAAIEAEEQRRNAKLTPEEAQAYYDTAKRGVEQVTEATRKQWEMSRTFDTGWKQAWQDYADNANNAANQARQVFSALSGAFESAFEQMVRTGKVSWKELLTDMTVQFMKADVQKLFSSITAPSSGGGASSGGLFSSIGKFFSGGFANGGFIPAGGYGITGENGPEYVNGPAQITPIQQGSTQVTYHINAVDAKSFQALLATQPDLIYGLSQKGARAAGA